MSSPQASRPGPDDRRGVCRKCVVPHWNHEPHNQSHPEIGQASIFVRKPREGLSDWRTKLSTRRQVGGNTFMGLTPRPSPGRVFSEAGEMVLPRMPKPAATLKYPKPEGSDGENMG